ncbi:MAG: serine/threonine-protein kinase [Deltaproteobacteria bacterium]
MGGMDYWLGQLLSLLFYIMTLIVYNRARKEYVGGKIAAAINLIMIFLLILFANDFVDYFLASLVPLAPDIITILKILIKLAAICVLFFGGLRFFVTQKAGAEAPRDTGLFDGMDLEVKPDSSVQAAPDPSATYDMPRQVQKPTLGRYEIIGQLGKGAMGIVYKGRDPKLNRLTAIKTIRFMDEYDEDKVEAIKSNFYREAELAAKLSHKNIVTVFDVGEDLDVSYLAMEYLEGKSLEQYTVQGDPLPVDQCIDIILQVCGALGYAHGRGIIHRDIKPGNIMVLPNGLIKVMDFGIARAIGGTRTKTGIIKGTPFYMSPEQAKGMALTPASDIFSLGIVFYQLLTGRLPFTGDTMAGIIYQTANVDPEPAESYNSSISPPVLGILKKSLSKAPEERFSTAAEMASELKALIAESGKEPPKPAESLSESAKGALAVKSVSGLQQTPGPISESEKDEASDPLDFDDLDQMVAEDTGFPKRMNGAGGREQELILERNRGGGRFRNCCDQPFFWRLSVWPWQERPIISGSAPMRTIAWSK